MLVLLPVFGPFEPEFHLTTPNVIQQSCPCQQTCSTAGDRRYVDPLARQPVLLGYIRNPVPYRYCRCHA